ncbi:MAG: class I SAM-dependent methyltransferase, partial [Gammaproteobacteria bacterium]|nr:class I SAM-dependent methyltransferase [Gammaproteobacteria bacterium]
MAKVLHSADNGFQPIPKTGSHRSTESWMGGIYARLLGAADIRVNGSREWDVQVEDERLWPRIALRGTLGLGEAYVDGWWDASRLDETFARLIKAKINNRIFNLPKRLGDAAAALGNLQRVARARRVGEVHYDLNTELYRAMLGERMVYSCAYWRNAATLDEAQEHKLELVCRKLELKPGMKVLDIGCGWGSFAKYAAENHDVAVVGITISRDLAILARRTCAGRDVVSRQQDSRELRGKCARIVSIGMLEHVGRKNYRLYMKIARRLLVEDGRFVLQTIGRNDSGS